MVFPTTALFIAGLAAQTVFANPLPPADCAFDAPPSCTVLEKQPHSAIPRNPLPPRDGPPCPLGGDCGSPTAVAPNPTPTSSTASRLTARTCTTHHGPIPIGTECFESGPRAGQCITFECLGFPNACGCPGAPLEPEEEEEEEEEEQKRNGSLLNVTSSIRVSTSTSRASLRSRTACTKWTGPFPIGEECFTNGPHAGECISFYCLERPDTCGCPGAPVPPAAAPTLETT